MNTVDITNASTMERSVHIKQKEINVHLGERRGYCYGFERLEVSYFLFFFFSSLLRHTGHCSINVKVTNAVLWHDPMRIAKRTEVVARESHPGCSGAKGLERASGHSEEADKRRYRLVKLLPLPFEMTKSDRPA